MCPLELLQPHRKLFLKASRSSESAPWALDGLGTWGLMPTFLSYSQPRWACTFSIPVFSSIQRATFGPLHIPPPSAELAAALPEPPEAPFAPPRRATPSPWLRDCRAAGRQDPPPPPTRSVLRSPSSISPNSPPFGPPPGSNPPARCARPSTSGYATPHRWPCGIAPPTVWTPIPPNFVSRSCFEAYTRIRYDSPKRA
jgi:hypothetical protein